MKSCEKFVSANSHYYIYSASVTAEEMFFYPLHTGNFTYEPGYLLRRDSFDSFLIMYIKRGTLTIDYGEKTEVASEGSFIFLDCYKPHGYSCDVECEALWCHFDGVLAKRYYENIVSHLGNIINLPDANTVVSKMNALFNIFHNHNHIKEPLISKYLNDILTSFLLYSPQSITSTNYVDMSEDIISYINEHFAENIMVSDLASIAKLSQYHFIRTFKKETGFTPHEYIINTRITNAKYLLKNSTLPIKDICFDTGFSSESVFCSSFKKYVGITPAQYRNATKF